MIGRGSEVASTGGMSDTLIAQASAIKASPCHETSGDLSCAM